jgi:hypothetical protein
MTNDPDDGWIHPQPAGFLFDLYSWATSNQVRPGLDEEERKEE